MCLHRKTIRGSNLPVDGSGNNDHHTQATAAGQAVRSIKQEIDELLASGLYDEDSDPVIAELKRSLASAEQRFARMHIGGGV